MDFKAKIEQLGRNKDIVANLITGISQDQAAWKPAEDRWSILEAINHVIDIEIEDFRHIFQMVLFNPEEKWPGFNEIEWITSRKYNERDINESVGNFIMEREKSIAMLEELGNPDLNAIHSGNGFTGERMKAGDVIVSWIGHDLFHIRQLTLLVWDILDKWSKPFSPRYSGFYA